MTAATFERLWHEVYPSLLRHLRITWAAEDAEDVAMEAFERAWRHRDRIDAGRNPKGWLMRVAQRAKQDRWKVESNRTRLAQFVSLDDEAWEMIPG